MRRWGAGMAWLVRAVLVLCVVLLVLYVFRAPAVGDDSMIGRTAIAGLGITVVLALLEGLRRWVRAPGPVPLQETEQAAHDLADAALNRWEDEARLRGITGPGQLPVGWRWAASDVAIPAERMNPPYEGPTTGLVTDLVQLYRALDPNWKRLVILGGPGSGKTAAMTLLLLNVLRDRKPDEPVPVWVTLGGWNPTEESLRHYAAAVIGRDFPSTRAQAAGGDAGPAALLDGRHVALFLDGLDEMPTRLQADAASLISLERTLPIVMTSRYPEYTSATTQVSFDGAVIEMTPLTIRQTIMALETGHRADRAAVWKVFTERLSHQASGTTLWTSPLIVSLLRQTYETTGNPSELLDAQKFPDDDAIRAALIERVLDQAYPDPNDREHATHWLAWIAANLKGTRDIQWWDIPRWTPGRRLTQRLMSGLMGGLTGPLLLVLVLWLVLALGVERMSGRETALVFGRVFGFVVGFVVGLVVGLVRGLGVGLVVGLGVGFVVGLVVGFGFWLVDKLMDGLAATTPRVAYGLDVRIGLTVGLVVGLVFGLLFGPFGRLSGGVFLSGVILGLRTGRPFSPMRFLEDARERQILRQVGSVYQFRHAELQDHLAPREPAW